MTASSPRHEMEMHVKLGAMKDGTIRGIDLYTISNTGAYGEHGPTTVGLSEAQIYSALWKGRSIPLCLRRGLYECYVFWAYRGYGATQGLAIETAVNELAEKLHMDPMKLREMNIVKKDRSCLHFTVRQIQAVPWTVVLQR